MCDVGKRSSGRIRVMSGEDGQIVYAEGRVSFMSFRLGVVEEEQEPRLSFGLPNQWVRQWSVQ